jgi:hypothetical protein
MKMTLDPLYKEVADSISLKIASLTDWNQQALQFGSEISSVPPEYAQAIFTNILLKAFKNKIPADIVVAKTMFLSIIYNYWSTDHIQRSRENAAYYKNRTALAFLVTENKSDENSAGENENLKIPQYRTSGTPTLGERRSFAAKPYRKNIELALMDPNPMVTAKILNNPQTVQRDVLKIASNRQASPLVLIEIAKHIKWRNNQRVIAALVNNRHLPLCYGLSLVPFLDRAVFNQLLTDLSIDAELKEAARILKEAAAAFE